MTTVSMPQSLKAPFAFASWILKGSPRTLPVALLAPSRGREHHAAAHLAQHQDVGGLGKTLSVKREMGEAGPGPRRAQTGEGIQLAAQPHQAVLHLRPAGDADAVPRRAADGADQ